MIQHEPLTREAEYKRGIAQAIRQSGLGAAYSDNKLGLSSCGKTGKLLSEAFQEGKILDSARQGIGLFIWGEGAAAYRLQMMACRAYLLSKISTKVVGLPYLDKMLSGQEDDYLEVSSAKVIGVRGWYEAEFGEAGMPADRRFVLDVWFRETLERGAALVLQSSKPPEDCFWWSVSLRQMVKDSTVIYEV